MTEVPDRKEAGDRAESAIGAIRGHKAMAYKSQKSVGVTNP